MVETLIWNIGNAKAFLAAFGITWTVFLVYLFRLIRSRKNLIKQRELLKNI